MKKILSLALALVMIFGVLPMAFAAEEPTAEVSQYQEVIDFLKLPGINIYHGTAVDEDGADENVTRWQMALFVSRFITGETEDDFWKTDVNDSGFTDVEKFEGSSEATLGAISFASQKGIVNGIGEGLFDPTADVTYQDAIVMIVRALGFNYKSSGYPWSYINKARELGLLEGISGIGYTQAAPRGVIAALLYNALFAEVDGETVAEKVFNIWGGIVMITASNNLFYEPDGATVSRSNYVQFKFIDEQGQPTGAAYHLPVGKFGISGGAEANAAVGTTYFVFFITDLSDLIYAEPLTETFWNKHGENEISYAKPTLKLGGTSYRVVNAFSDLNNVPGSVSGSNEAKVFKAFGGTKTSVGLGSNTKYLVAANGSIYDTTYSITDPIVYYNAVLDIYYEKNQKKDADGNKVYDANGNPVYDGTFNVLSYEKVAAKYLAYSTASNGSFGQLAADGVAPYVSAFTKAIVSGTYYDDNKLVTLRNYSFGRITFENKYDRYKNKNGGGISHAVKPTFYIFTGNQAWGLDHVKNNTQFATYENASKKDNKWVAAGGGTAPRYNEDYRWTGLNWGSYSSGTYYVLYYLDEQNYEIDILEAFAVKDGYVKGYDALNNKITIDEKNDGLTTYTYGYNNLTGSSIVTKDYKGWGSTESNYTLATNLSAVVARAGHHISFVMIDDKIVWADGASDSGNDYIIADKIVAYGQDGITVQAYTTVDNTYKEIKITEFNGWQLGSYDANYYFYYLAGLISGSSQNVAAPINLYEIYNVQNANKNGGYNLTTATDGTKAEFTIYESGLIVGTDGNGNLGAQRYTTVNDKDYWLILIPEHYEVDADGNVKYDTNGNRIVVAAQVAQYSGKLGATTITGVNVIKCKSNDYVLKARYKDGTVDPDTGIGVLENNNILNDLKAVTMTNVKYMVYAYSAYTTQYQYVYNASQSIGYSVYMTNIQDASTKVVTWNPYDATAAFVVKDNRVTTIDPKVGLKPGAIYMVVDDIVVGEYVGTLDELATTKFTVSGDVSVATFNYAPVGDKDTDLSNVRLEIAKQIATLVYGLPDGSAKNSWANNNKGKVTTYAVAEPYTGTYVVQKSNLANVPTDTGAWTVAYIIHSNGNADAWIAPIDATSDVTATVAAIITTTSLDISADTSVSATKDNLTGKTTVVITLPTETGKDMSCNDETVFTFTASEGTVTATKADGHVTTLTITGVTADSLTLTVERSNYGNVFDFTVTLG